MLSRQPFPITFIILTLLEYCDFIGIQLREGNNQPVFALLIDSPSSLAGVREQNLAP